MTSPSVPYPLSPIPAAPAAWLSLEEASRRSGRSPRHLRRLCGEAWLAEGKARQSGDRQAWEIRSDALPGLSLTPFMSPGAASGLAAPGSSFSDFPKSAREWAMEKARILAQWADAKRAAVSLNMTAAQATAVFCERIREQLAAKGIEARPATLYRWAKSHKAGGLVGLIDGRAKQSLEPRGGAEAGEMLKKILSLWLDKRKKSLKLCFDIALAQAEEKGWPAVSYDAAKRHVAKWCQENPGAAILRREGEKAFTDKAEPFIEGDYTPLASNEIWCADHHVFDVIVRVGERLNVKTGEIEPIHARPWLTAWQDLRSRKIVGHLIRAADPDTWAILAAGHAACRDFSVPFAMYTDNGKDFDCKVLTGMTKAERWRRKKVHVAHDQKKLGGIYAACGIKHIRAWPYHGQSKPIERFFRRVEEEFGKTFETYCGPNPQQKPEDLSLFRGKPGHLEKGHAPALEEFIAAFDQWLEVGYHQQPHRGQGMDGKTPDQVFAENLAVKRTISEETLALLWQPAVGPVKVTQNGVLWQGIGYGGGYAAELAGFLGREVLLRIDARDLSRVTVFDMEDRPLAVATANRLVPRNATQEELRAAIGVKKSRTRTLKLADEIGLRLHEDVTDLMLEARAKKAAELQARYSPPDAPPPTLMPVRTDLEGHMAAIEELHTLRRAVGAESLAADIKNIGDLYLQGDGE